MIEEMIVLVLTIWKADSTMRENSLVGESEMDRQSRRWVAIICVSLAVIGILWWSGRS
jgi:hypothetical protein